jgi:hypothetical protein
MKAKSFFSGLALFLIGMVAMFAIESNGRHHDFKHQSGARKSAVIEVGAPLTADQLRYEGFN